MIDYRGGIDSPLRCTFAQKPFGLFETGVFSFLCASFVYRSRPLSRRVMNAKTSHKTGVLKVLFNLHKIKTCYKSCF
jgi:hypothetical protein